MALMYRCGYVTVNVHKGASDVAAIIRRSIEFLRDDATLEP
jgi:hypothetical protein